MNKSLKQVTKTNPCPHCGKTDWCYSIGDLSVCNRDYPPAEGWYETSKCDREGHVYYALVDTKPQKQMRQSQTRTWEYYDHSGNKLVRVVRIDPQKIIWQEYWLEHPELAKFRTKDCWVKLSQKDYQQKRCTEAQWKLFNQLKQEIRKHIPIYRYQDIKQAISENKTIFIVEGESCADKLWNLGIPATTNIGGSKKWQKHNTIEIQKEFKHLNPSIVLCPDRDQPGIEHMEKIFHDFPSAQWLYAFPQSSVWSRHLPPSKGLDIADWIDELKSSHRLSNQQIVKTIYQSIEKYRRVTISSDNKLNLGLSNTEMISNSDVNKSDNNCVNDNRQNIVAENRKLDKNEGKITDEELFTKLGDLINQAPKQSSLTNLFQKLSKLVGQPPMKFVNFTMI